MEDSIYVCTEGEFVLLWNYKKQPDLVGRLCIVEGIRSGRVLLRMIADGKSVHVLPSEFIDAGEYGYDADENDAAAKSQYAEDDSAEVVEGVAMEIERDMSRNFHHFGLANTIHIKEEFHTHDEVIATIRGLLSSSHPLENTSKSFLACGKLESIDGGKHIAEALDIYTRMLQSYPHSTRAAVHCARLRWSMHKRLATALEDDAAVKQWCWWALRNCCTQNSMLEDGASAEEMIQCYQFIVSVMMEIGSSDRASTLETQLVAAIRILNIARLRFRTNCSEFATGSAADTAATIADVALSAAQRSFAQVAHEVGAQLQHMASREAAAGTSVPVLAAMRVLAMNCSDFSQRITGTK